MKRFLYVITALGFTLITLPSYAISFTSNNPEKFIVQNHTSGISTPASDPSLISIPKYLGGFAFGGGFYFLGPSSENGTLNIASINTSDPDHSLHSQMKTIDPGYNWGFEITAGYVLPDSANDLNLTYFHFDTDEDNNGGGVLPTGSVTAPFFNSNLNTFSTSAAQTTYRINQGDLTFAQYINVGTRIQLHPNMGLRYTNLERKIESFYGLASNFVDPTSVSGTFNAHEDSDFSGLGPLAGMDMRYYLGGGFNAVAHLTGALLIGNLDNKTEIEQSLAILAQNLPANLSHVQAQNESQQRLVPATDLKFGADYTYFYPNARNSNVILEIGYQASHYFNVTDRMTETFTTSTGINTNLSSAITANQSADVALDGFYANLTWHI